MADQEKKRRRLPVLQAPKPEEEDAARPGWHWSVIVGLGTLFGWLLVEMTVVGPVSRGLAAPERSVLAAGIHLAALALPAGASAALAGRLGSQARRVHAIAGAVGLVAIVAAVSLARVGGGPTWSLASALAALVAGVASSLGFSLGRRHPAPEA